MKTKEIRVIRSAKQYSEYLTEIDKLMDIDPSPNSSEGQLLETLVILVEDYEKKKGWEIPVPENPVDIIKTRMDDLGLKQYDLAKAVGDKTGSVKNTKRFKKAYLFHGNTVEQTA